LSNQVMTFDIALTTCYLNVFL